MTSGSRKCRIAGLALVAVLGVSGCTFHPGSAALVNATTISQSSVDDLVDAACAYTLATRLKSPTTAGASTSVGALKHLFTQNLVSFAITDKAARQLHLTVSQAAIGKASGQQQQGIPATLSDSDKATLTTFFDDSSRSQLEQVLIGAHLKDSSVTSISQVDSADYQSLLTSANAYLARFTQQQSVQVNPAYGSWDGSAVGPDDGSLSSPASSVALKWSRLAQAGTSSVTGLPANQVCG